MEDEKKDVFLGEEMVKQPPVQPEVQSKVEEEADAEKLEVENKAEEVAEEKVEEEKVEQAESKETTDAKVEATEVKDESKKSEMAEAQIVESQVAPETPTVTNFDYEAERESLDAVNTSNVMSDVNDMNNSDMLNLRNVKADESRTRFQKFVANICGISPNKKMTKMNTFTSLLWCAAKVSVASVVFGPLVGAWAVAHYNHHTYFADKEEKAFKFINAMMFNDDLIVGPSSKDNYQFINELPKDASIAKTIESMER